jgi:hypothetical protein
MPRLLLPCFNTRIISPYLTQIPFGTSSSRQDYQHHAVPRTPILSNTRGEVCLGYPVNFIVHHTSSVQTHGMVEDGSARMFEQSSKDISRGWNADWRTADIIPPTNAPVRNTSQHFPQVLNCDLVLTHYRMQASHGPTSLPYPSPQPTSTSSLTLVCCL